MPPQTAQKTPRPLRRRLRGLRPVLRGSLVCACVIAAAVGLAWYSNSGALPGPASPPDMQGGSMLATRGDGAEQDSAWSTTTGPSSTLGEESPATEGTAPGKAAAGERGVRSRVVYPWWHLSGSSAEAESGGRRERTTTTGERTTTTRRPTTTTTQPTTSTTVVDPSSSTTEPTTTTTIDPSSTTSTTEATTTTVDPSSTSSSSTSSSTPG